MPSYCVALDQGTMSTRCIVFDHAGRIVGQDQREHEQVYPRPGWVEHNPNELWQRAQETLHGAVVGAGLSPRDIVAIGIANQRETTIVWDRRTGTPLHNAIVWQDTRTDRLCEELGRKGGADRFRAQTGLPLATYFAGPKIMWILDHVPGAREMAERGEALFGTVDTFLTWWLTGGPDGGRHVTDVTNASRTLLMNLNTLDWDQDILSAMDIPRQMLPEIRSSCERYGFARSPLPGVPIGGILGDQQAALVGQACFGLGEVKSTYGTGCFVLLNSGNRPVPSRSGLLTTVAYKLGDGPPTYALEGAVAIAGALVQWLRDNLGLIERSSDVETLANTVRDNGGVYFVPAFSGLFAPYWRSDARGVIVGLTRYANRGHVARAALEATAFQTRDVLEAMERDCGVRLGSLRVDGGMVRNNTLMQFQADVLGVPVVRSAIVETTALGVAYAAGLAEGFWGSLDEIRKNCGVDRIWEPRLDDQTREVLYHNWKRAVERTLGWIEG